MILFKCVFFVDCKVKAIVFIMNYIESFKAQLDGFLHLNKLSNVLIIKSKRLINMNPFDYEYYTDF